MEKTFGQIAYEAYCSKVGLVWVTDFSPAEWQELPPKEKELWELTASAVKEELNKRMKVNCLV